MWLPLPHLITIPFVLSDWAWRTGVAGSVGSMVAYVLGALGIFRLMSRLVSRPAAWVATAIYVCNPNLIYMQATAMTETIFLASVIWAVVFFTEYVQGIVGQPAIEVGRALVKCALALAMAMFTRYDGWFLAAFIVIATLFCWLRAESSMRRVIRRHALLFVALVLLPPLSWFAYNWRVYKNPLEFANGPYSARAIAEQSTKNGDAPHPGYRDVSTARRYFIECAKLNVGEGRTKSLLFMIAAVAGWLTLLRRGYWTALLLWIPLPFYALSIAYGGVPIFMPAWTPYSYYNVRYGLELLPAIAVFVGLMLEYLLKVNYSQRFNRILSVIFVALITVSYASVVRATPICLREARVNSVTRAAFESVLARQLLLLPNDARLMMYTGSYSGALQKAGIHLKRVVTENNYDDWRAALESPARSADYVIAIDGDPVSIAAKEHPENLRSLVVVHSLGKPPATIYASEKSP